MRAAIAWSYDLLSEPERRLFANLAVFSGSFELEAAEQICAAAPDILQSLIEKSLLRQVERGRYFLLQTTREFALEQFGRATRATRFAPGMPAGTSRLGVAARGRDPDRAEALVRLRQDAADVGLTLAWALDHDIAAALTRRFPLQRVAGRRTQQGTCAM